MRFFCCRCLLMGAGGVPLNDFALLRFGLGGRGGGVHCFWTKKKPALEVVAHFPPVLSRAGVSKTGFKFLVVSAPGLMASGMKCGPGCNTRRATNTSPAADGKHSAGGNSHGVSNRPVYPQPPIRTTDPRRSYPTIFRVLPESSDHHRANSAVKLG